jgi:hypothetical protein
MRPDSAIVIVSGKVTYDEDVINIRVSNPILITRETNNYCNCTEVKDERHIYKVNDESWWYLHKLQDGIAIHGVGVQCTAAYTFTAATSV